MDQDCIEPIFDAGREHNFMFNNFMFDKLGDITFDVVFPKDFTEDQFIDVCREYQLDELVDLIAE
jgi:hypothetical protein